MTHLPAEPPPAGSSPAGRPPVGLPGAGWPPAGSPTADPDLAGLPPEADPEPGFPPAGLLDEPSDAELAGCWPDPFAGPPDDGDAWVDGLSPAQLDAIFGTAGDEVTEEEVASFAAGGPLDVLPPGPVLAAMSQDVAGAGLRRLSDDELAGVLRASRRLSSWQAGVELTAVAELDGRRMRAAARPGSSRASEHVSDELAAALVLTGRAADVLLTLARDLVRLPTVLAALLAGRIDRARAAIFASELAGLTDLQAAAVAMAFIGPAGSMTTGQLRAALRSMVLYVDPAALRRRAEKARADARVETWPESSGNAALAGRELPPADAIAADERITAIARALKDGGAPGTMDQLRAAVFTALLAGRDPETLLPGQPPGRDGQARDGQARDGQTPDARPSGLAALTGSVHLTMPVSAWLDLSHAPGEVAGLGPLDAWTCRELADRLAAGPGTRWCVTLTGPDSRAVAHACARGSPGRTRQWLAGLSFSWLESGTCGHSRQAGGYRPGNLLRELVKIRQRTCGFPGCRRPARSCDDDHTIPYDHGGRTCECNLEPLCRRHHHAKQAPGWSLTQPEPGLLIWTTPHGRSYTVRPNPYPV